MDRIKEKLKKQEREIKDEEKLIIKSLDVAKIMVAILGHGLKQSKKKYKKIQQEKEDMETTSALAIPSLSTSGTFRKVSSRT